MQQLSSHSNARLGVARILWLQVEPAWEAVLSKSTMRSANVLRFGLGWLALLSCAVALAWSVWRTWNNPIGDVPSVGFEAARTEFSFETSQNCVVCHPQRTASWGRTFHRTMTQRAGERSVAAPFDQRAIEVFGVRTTPRRLAGGLYAIETAHPVTGAATLFPIDKTVGSRRIQQYISEVGDRRIRLPIAYSIEEQRWFHLSEAFFSPDSNQFHEFTSIWDYNCIFCHNVKAGSGWRPRAEPPREFTQLGVPSAFPGAFDARVEELGIACEACHGPGEEHSRRMRSPLRRYVYHASNFEDPTIVNPQRLDRSRSIAVCGQCHGQRLPVNEQKGLEMLQARTPFTAGEALEQSFLTIWHDTVYQGYAFSSRFWSDGSPRLTAYEYQGLLRSPCAQDARFTCLSCHSMHSGDPHGQLRPDLPGDQLCTQCHTEFVGSRRTQHTQHRQDSPGSACVACHMPSDVYGVMAWHPNHQIQTPDPVRSSKAMKPDACTLCHTGRSIAWAVREMQRLWPDHGGPAENLDPSYQLAELARALQSADAVYRTLAAHSLGAPPFDPKTSPELLIPLLAGALTDPYPNVRRTAANSLRQLTGMTDVPWAHSPIATRSKFREIWMQHAVSREIPDGFRPLYDPQGKLDLQLVAQLMQRRRELPISIGE
jgi:predicted CXXCH cytochrome family protein